MFSYDQGMSLRIDLKTHDSHFLLYYSPYPVNYNDVTRNHPIKDQSSSVYELYISIGIFPHQAPYKMKSRVEIYDKFPTHPPRNSIEMDHYVTCVRNDSIKTRYARMR